MGARRRDVHAPRRHPAEPDGARTAASVRFALSRVVDVVVSSLVLVATLPVVVLAALAVKLGSPGPVISRHARVGRDGAPFELFRFRSTVHEPAERMLRAGEALPVVDERRATVTRVGRILRWSSIDELPQLWNVLRGDMTLVGPPPDLPGGSSPGGLSDPIRLLPGLTGTWSDVDDAGVDQEACSDSSGPPERGGRDARAG